MADNLERVLHAVIEREVVRTDQKTVQMNAGARTPAETVSTNQTIELDRERQRANDLAPAFADGLRRAHAARQAGHHELVLDDRRADENAIADALVQFLVRPQLATSQTDRTEPNHYTYRIAIDWSRLEALTAAAGFDLPKELAHS